MMNISEMTTNSIHTLQTLETEAPDLPTLDLPPNALDPGNFLAWVLCLRFLLGSTGEVINAIAKLLKAIASLNPKKQDQDQEDS